jgi:kynurenine formamidase
MPPTIERVAQVSDAAGWEADRLTLFTLTGTYLEASAHLRADGERIDEISPDRFIRPATILHLPDAGPGHKITPDELIAAGGQPQPGDALLISTGWDRMWHRLGFVENSPHFTQGAMAWLLDQSPAIIGGDIPCFDHPTQPVGVNHALFAAGCLILAPLVNLRQARMDRPLLIALPLRVKGVCGTPCRALLLDQDEIVKG